MQLVEVLKGQFNRLYFGWEARTAALIESVSRNPQLVEYTSSLLNGALRHKAFLDDALWRLWRLAGLPNKRDQERTLHLLNVVLSRVSDLEERLEDLGAAPPPAVSPAAAGPTMTTPTVGGPAPSATDTAPRRGRRH